MNRRRFFHELVGSSLIATAFTNPLLAETPRLTGLGGPKLKWQKNLKAAQKLAVEQNKPILIVFGASWCTYCHKLEKETLGDKKVVSLIEREFIPVHLDYDKDSRVAKILEVERLPCTVILSPEADLLQKVEGYAEAREFQVSLNSALEKRDEVQQVRATGTR